MKRIAMAMYPHLFNSTPTNTHRQQHRETLIIPNSGRSINLTAVPVARNLGKRRVRQWQQTILVLSSPVAVEMETSTDHHQ
jgi:hypothetical protein